MSFLYVGLGGACGCALRYAVSLWLGREVGKFPVETLFVNVTSSFIIGILAALALLKGGWFNNESRTLLMSGFCGGYSTLATLGLQTLVLMKMNSWWLAGLNIVANVIISMGALCAGYFLVCKFLHS